MKIIGIITEYNPFHNGHQYQIQEIRKKEHADYVIVAMSGDFVQRGGPAIIDKYTRTKMALTCGADLVIMLPVCVSLSSARTFARGGVGILSALGTDCLTYGCENPDVSQLKGFASFFQKEDPIFSNLLKEHLKEGLSYPAARQEAFLSYSKNYRDSINLFFPHNNPNPEILSSPNNILGIEYEQALLDLKSNMVSTPLKRIGQQYHDTNSHHEFASASAIRNHLLSQKQLPEIGLPVPAQKIMKKALQISGPLTDDSFSNALEYKLLESSISSFTNFPDCSKELANRILSLRDEYQSFSQFVTLIKTKGYTQTRIQRLFMQILLHITSYSQEKLSSCNYAPYARILGFRSTSEPLLKELTKRSSIPILTTPSQARTKLEDPSFDLFSEDLFASDYYRLIQKQQYHIHPKNDYKQPLIIL